MKVRQRLRKKRPGVVVLVSQSGGSLRSIRADNYSVPDGFCVETGDGQEGIVTYQEIADVALGKKLSEQLTLFEEVS